MKTITKKKLVRKVLGICEQYPELRNPSDECTCIYFKPQTLMGENQRCLIAEYLNRLGYDVRDMTGNADAILRSMPDGTFTEAAIVAAQEIQVFADDHGRSRPWSEVAEWIHQTYDLVD